MVYDVDGVVVPLVGKYRCKNPKCKMVMDSAKTKAKKQEEEQGGQKESDIVWDDAAVLSWCKDGVSFNTMDDRFVNFVCVVKYCRREGARDGWTLAVCITPNVRIRSWVEDTFRFLLLAFPLLCFSLFAP